MKHVMPSESDPKDINLISMLNQGLSKKGNLVSRNRLWASSAGLCMRRNTLQNDSIASSISDDTDSRRHMYQELGKHYESQIIQSYRNLGVLRFADYKLPILRGVEELNIGGKVDLIIEVNHELIGIEVKTRGSDLKIKPDDISQASIYHLITGLPFYVLIADRNVANYKVDGLNARQHKIAMSQDDKTSLAYKLFLSEFLIKHNKNFAFKNSIYGSSVCDYCPFKNICDKHLINDVEIPDDVVYQITQKAQKFVELTQSRKNGITKFIRSKGKV